MSALENLQKSMQDDIIKDFISIIPPPILIKIKEEVKELAEKEIQDCYGNKEVAIKSVKKRINDIGYMIAHNFIKEDKEMHAIGVYMSLVFTKVTIEEQVSNSQ